MKKRNLFPLTVSLLLALALLAGCAAPAPEASSTTQPATPQESIPQESIPSEPVPSETAAPEARPAMRLATLKGPTGMGMVGLMQRNDAQETAVEYAFTIASTPDEISAKLITGEVDVAAAPINLASTLYNKTNGEVELIALNTLGVLYILENGDSIHSLGDLAGKTLYATGQGATPEYILNYLLAQAGIAGQVEVQYMNDHAELATMLAAEQVEIAMLPEPNVTAALMSNDSLRVALNLTEEWNALAGDTTLVQGAIVARREYIQQNPDAVAQFLQEYASSVAFVNSDIDTAAELIVQYEIMAAVPAAKRAIPNSNIVCMTGEEMKTNASAMLAMLFEANPQSIGGMLPEDAFYYMP